MLEVIWDTIAAVNVSFLILVTDVQTVASVRVKGKIRVLRAFLVFLKNRTREC